MAVLLTVNGSDWSPPGRIVITPFRILTLVSVHLTDANVLYFSIRTFLPGHHHWDVTGSWATAEVSRVGGHADQGHARSLILVRKESPYATSYRWIILTDILSRTVFQSSCSIDQIIALMHSFFVICMNVAINHILPKNKFFGLYFCWGQCRSIFNQFDAVGFNI